MPKITKSDINFEVKRKAVSFSVYHNLPETFGMNIEGAVNNWLARTKRYTATSLCKYIMSKDPSFVCMDQAQWDRLNQK